MKILKMKAQSLLQKDNEKLAVMQMMAMIMRMMIITAVKIMRLFLNKYLLK